MNFLREGPKFPWEKGTFPREQFTFPKERPKFPKETSVSNIFTVKIISFLFLCVIATYHWKDLEKNHNLVDGNISIKIYMQKLQSKKQI
jgi:hypothetical protein